MKRRSTFGWLDLLTGVLFLGMGIALFVSPQMALTWLVVLLGVSAILSGISDIILYTKTKLAREDGLAPPLAVSIICALAGLLLVIYPVVGQWVLHIILPLWFIARCISRIMGYSLLKRIAGKTPAVITLCLNAAALLLGIIMLFNAPLFTLSLGLLIAVELIMLGTSNMIEAFSCIGSADII